MRSYIKLARPHHWIKNLLVLLPLMCSGQLLQWSLLRQGLWAFLAFSLMASAIYCVNDIRDRETDRTDPVKRRRPVASGAVSVGSAVLFCLILILLALVCAFFASRNPICWLWLGLYLLLNLGYSLGLKDLPLIDVAILASGYLLRLLYGGGVTGIELSTWLCLTIIAVSFYLGLGKRRGELMEGKGQRRAVLQYYSERFLGYNMYLCVALAVMFYAFWTVDALTVQRAGGDGLVWTVPLVLLICMRYSLDVESGGDGDPVEILLHDRLLLILGAALALAILAVLYII